ncbi:cysteine protease ATG4D-like [Vespula maculifrons]|uniref:Cysteine protease n=4 Tax=Vespula TaxID=7451 RepID=A0A834N4B0_VESGE|nr:cysteine protease ATG4D [Vespula pensylvanica]XP_050857408.1 cysteine protease ATG4D [Vespula vulgaris]KAF7393293.1 hypothetical protein HZH66_009126 [Vespula vulgaris]KAF7395762.1 hypothetical protein HZH68_009812 [Vespula germanica]KAF7420064.1 hypothetical protein H0235_010361 [Vespula pensylvanica]
MKGQVQAARERLGGFSNNSYYPSSADHVPDIQRIVPISNYELQLDDSAVVTEVDNKVKTKLLSIWNNVKYGWTVKIKTNFSKESPVWLLGQRYPKQLEDTLEKASEALSGLGTGSEVSLAIDAASYEEGIEGFKRDFVSRLWLTYRREFPNLRGSTFTTDCGWGCMLRSGQMMMAQALVYHFLGRDWRWYPDQTIKTDEQNEEEKKHRMIIKWFGDQPGPHSPLSIHKLVSLGAQSGKQIGDWYGPGSVAHLLSQAVKSAAEIHKEFSNLCVYVAQDCAVYLDDVKKLCETPNESWRSLVLLVPLRLGTDKLNPTYIPCLTKLLELEFCIGIIGGRPRHSLYFIGYQEDKLIHLDPHYCQESVDMSKEMFSLSTFHCTSPRKMVLSKMDPSCCIGFYIHDKSSFDEFVTKVENILIPQTQKTDYPMFLFCEGSGEELRENIEVGENPLPSTTLFVRPDAFEDHYEFEEFELICIGNKSK